ncbi:LysR family transcriptional regulator [Celerinatantimonas sp. MCCC 1A17872]|uniref:LysR family transcriptional regulator n=1 Tax=Celerinatantimonas sp. MCCC 1A17872 TaxID=3177514 RepID=UPI0038CB36AE
MDRIECDRMFVAVMEQGSFIKAAKRLGTSAGQASKLISKLEQELDIQLFKRTTRALSPTDVALSYYERVKTLLEEFDALDASVRNIARNPSGKLTISAPSSFGPTQLTPVLMRFASQYPQIELDVNFTDRLVNLVNEGFDLAIRIGKLDDSSLMARKLGDIRVAVVASPEYLAKQGRPNHWQQLANHAQIIDSNSRTPRLWRFCENGQDYDLPVKGRLRMSDPHACLQAVCAGLGVAQLPIFVASKALQEQQIEIILQEYEMPPLGLYVIYPPARHLAQKSRVLIDFLSAWFQQKLF